MTSADEAPLDHLNPFLLDALAGLDGPIWAAIAPALKTSYVVVGRGDPGVANRELLSLNRWEFTTFHDLIGFVRALNPDVVLCDSTGHGLPLHADLLAAGLYVIDTRAGQISQPAMRFSVDFMLAGPNGGLRVCIDGVPVADSPNPFEAAEDAGREMWRRWTDTVTAANTAKKAHAKGEPCAVCDGTGFDYLGRRCRHLVEA